MGTEVITSLTFGFFVALFCWCCCGGCYVFSFLFHLCDYGCTTDHFLPGHKSLYVLAFVSALELIFVPLIAYGLIPLVLPLGLAFVIGCGFVLVGFIFHLIVLVIFYKKYAKKEDEVYIPPVHYVDRYTGAPVSSPHPTTTLLNNTLASGNHNFEYMKVMGTVNRHAVQLVLMMYILMFFITPAFYPFVYLALSDD